VLSRLAQRCGDYRVGEVLTEILEMVESVETRAADVGESGGRLLRGVDRGAGVLPAQPLGTGPEKVRQSHVVGEMEEKRSCPLVLRSLQVHGAIACLEKQL